VTPQRALAVALALLAVAGAAGLAFAGEAPSRAVVDRVVVRFFSPETGGPAQPRFVGERMLAFEARLEAMSDRPGGLGEDYDERSVRAALDHHIGEELLASLALKLIAGTPAERRPSESAMAAVRQSVGDALFARLGGEERVASAAAAEQLARYEVDDLLRRQALAAWYIDRALTPILQPTEEQLREVFRTGGHPFRGRSFDEARESLERWFVGERLRVAEASFFQGARSRLHVVVTE
jgi:hypothetical protein